MAPTVTTATGPVAAVVLAVATARRGAHRTVARARRAMRTGGVLSRVLATGAVITVVQWALLATMTAPWVWGVALGAPALLAGSAVHPMFTMTTVTHTRLTGRGKGR